VQYKFSPTLNAYATIARGFTPADEIEENFVVHPYRPEIATNYEMGLKSLLEHGVQLNAAIFYTNYADRLYLFQQLAEKQIIDLTTNVGPSKNYGVEFDVSAPLPDGFKVSAGMGYHSSGMGRGAKLHRSSDFSANQYQGPVRCNFAPAYTANTTLEWKHGFGGYELGWRATTSFVGRSYWDPQDAAYQRAYHLVNLSSWVERWHLETVGRLVHKS